MIYAPYKGWTRNVVDGFEQYKEDYNKEDIWRYNKMSIEKQKSSNELINKNNEIEYRDNLTTNLDNILEVQFSNFAKENNIDVNYEKFVFVAKGNNKIIGVAQGFSSYNEAIITDFIILNKYRLNNYGKTLLYYIEEFYRKKRFDNINLTTYRFQAPGFYEKLRI